MVFTKAKLIGGGIVVLVISLTIWAGYKYVTNLQETVVEQAEKITELKISNESLTAEREQLESDLKDNRENQAVLHEELREARKQKDGLIKLFSDHDFAKLVNAKPGLIEKRINKGTDKVFQELEDISDE